MTPKRLDFKETLAEAKAELLVTEEELGECLAKQEEIETRLVALRQAITAFSNALGVPFDEADEIGLTDAVRQAFKNYDKHLEPTEIRSRLQTLGFNVRKYGNFMASLHTILNRLVKYGEIKQVLLQGGKQGYVSVHLVEQGGKK